MLPAYTELEQLEARVDLTIRHVEQRMVEQLRAGFSTGESFHRNGIVKLVDKVHPPPSSSETLVAGLSHCCIGGGVASSSAFDPAPIASQRLRFAFAVSSLARHPYYQFLSLAVAAPLPRLAVATFLWHALLS